MRVEGAGPGTAARGAQRTRSAGGTGFAVPDAGDAAPADAASPETAALPVSLLPLDIAPEPAVETDSIEADKAAARHGEDLLEALASLQRALTSGNPAAARETLRALAEHSVAAAHPGLQNVLQALAQRAAVELARGA